jgi:hypothetical protein
MKPTINKNSAKIPATIIIGRSSVVGLNNSFILLV